MMKGKSIESLMKEVQKIDEATRFTSIFKSRQKLTFSATYQGGKLRDWQITPEGCQYKADTTKSGKRYDTLASVLDSYETFANPGLGLSVITLVDSTGEKVWNDEKGYECIYTQWAIVDSLSIDRSAEMDTFTIPLDEREYRIVLETTIALFDEATGTLYPFTKRAIPSLGTMLGSQSLIRKISNMFTALGTALLLYEKLISKKDYSLCYRNDMGDMFHPIIAIEDAERKHTTRKQVIETIQNEMNRFMISWIAKWQIKEEISVSFQSDLYEIRIHVPIDKPGTIRAEAWRKIVGAGILVIKNTVSESRGFGKNDAKALIDPLGNAITEFENEMDILNASPEISFRKEMADDILAVLGSKRKKLSLGETSIENVLATEKEDSKIYEFASQKLSSDTIPEDGIMKPREILEKVIRATAFEMPKNGQTDWNVRLGEAYNRFFHMLRKESENA